MKQNITVTKSEHFGIARKIVSNMTAESWENIPHVVLTYKPEATGILDVLKEINSSIDSKKKITVNTVVMRIIIEGLKACPALNAHLEFNRRLVRGHLKTIEEINISMPIVLKTGEMMTVNLHDMHLKSLSQIRDAVSETVRKANNSDMNEVMFEVSMDNTIQGLKKGKIMQTINRLVGSKTGKHRVKTLTGEERKRYYSIPEAQRLTKHDIEQGTITVSNLGSICKNWSGDCTLLEIIPPQVCAIAIGAATLSPVADHDGSIRAGKILPLTVAFDHRALDMGDVTPFIDKLNEIFDNPQVIKEWL